MKNKKINNYNLYYDKEIYLKYFQDVIDNKFETLKILKDTSRSLVKFIKFKDGFTCLYKEPREKNKRKWQKFIGIFRGSEAKRNFKSLEKIENMRIKTSSPYLAIEIKKGIIIQNSFILMEYIDGKIASEAEYNLIINKLKEIHKLGILHGDSQIANFLVKDKDVYVIDSSAKNNYFGSLNSDKELIELEVDLNNSENYLLEDRKRFTYKINKTIYILQRAFRRWKTKRRNK